MKEKGKRKNEKGEVLWLLLLTFSFFVFPFSFAAAQPSTQPADQIGQWFMQLADDDPSVRDAARVHLMGLKRGELDVLRRVVEQHQPLAPAQSASLRDIVFHVFLSGEDYEKLPLGFMGVMLQEVHQPAVASPDDAADEPAQSLGRMGVLVAQRVPGFCGFRYLRENDIIVGVVGQDVIGTAEGRELTELVKATTPGETITLQLIRQGKPMRISFRVDSRPLEADVRHQVEEFRNPRLIKAEEYWQKTFAPLVVEKLS